MSKLNEYVSKISTILKFGNLDVGEECIKISELCPEHNDLNSREQEIYYILECISEEPLNDKMNLNPKIFKAQHNVQRRLKIN